MQMKPRADVTSSPKQGYQWPHKEDCRYNVNSIFTHDEDSFSPEWQKFCLIGPSSPYEFPCFDSALRIASSDQKQHVYSPGVTVRWFYECPVLSGKIFEFLNIERIVLIE